MTMQQAMGRIQPLCKESMQGARARFSQIAIPLGSLGLLEEAVIQLAGIQRRTVPDISKRAVVVLCADNGVVAQGVTQCGQEITAVVTENLGRGQTAVCLMARQIGVDVFPVDIGVAREVTGEMLYHRKVMYGTNDITKAPAMHEEQLMQAIAVGISLACHCHEDGYKLLCVGEMGIGNTTTTAAVSAALLGVPAAQVTGRGAGLSNDGLYRKLHAVEKALDLHQLDPNNPLQIVQKVGGLDLAGMIGLYLGSAACGMPVVADGVITCAAALCAVRLCPAVRDYILVSHQSDEPAGKLLLEALSAKPFLTAGMRLGEGTGAVAAVGLLDLALAAYAGMPSFEDIKIQAYQPFA